jgi:hypothetical protein
MEDFNEAFYGKLVDKISGNEIISIPVYGIKILKR